MEPVSGMIAELEEQRLFMATRAVKFAGEIARLNSMLQSQQARIAELEAQQKPPASEWDDADDHTVEDEP